MKPRIGAAESRSPYSVHPSVARGRAILENLPRTTGRSLEGWIGRWVRTSRRSDGLYRLSAG